MAKIDETTSTLISSMVAVQIEVLKMLIAKGALNRDELVALLNEGLKQLPAPEFSPAARLPLEAIINGLATGPRWTPVVIPGGLADPD